MTRNPYIERSFEKSGIKDGHIDSPEALKQQRENIDRAIALGHSDFLRDARQAQKAENGLYVPKESGFYRGHELFGIVHASHIEHEEQLDANTKALENRLGRPEAKAKLQAIHEAFAKADVEAEYFLSDKHHIKDDPLEQDITRAAARLKAELFSKPAQVVFDIDNTITEDEGTYYAETVPGTAFGDPLMNQYGRGIFSKVYSRGWAPAQEHFPETFKSAGLQVPLRPGIDKFQSELVINQHTIKIMTAGMDPLAKAIISQLQMRGSIKDEHFRSICLDNVNSNIKPLSIRDMALENADMPVVFVGDGSSDAPLAIQGLPIAFYFALENAGFLAAIKEENLRMSNRKSNRGNLLYFPYKTHHDTLEIMARIWNRMEEMEELPVAA